MEYKENVYQEKLIIGIVDIKKTRIGLITACVLYRVVEKPREDPAKPARPVPFTGAVWYYTEEIIPRKVYGKKMNAV